MEHYLKLPLAISPLIAVSLLLAGCGGGGGSDSPGTLPPPVDSSTPGIAKGTIVSTTTGQSASVVTLTGPDGQSMWMTTDGRIWSGQMPIAGDRFTATMTGHMYEGAQFPDGTNHGTGSFMIDHHSSSATTGRYTGHGDAGTFSMGMTPMWNRPASLETVAGVYTRSTSSGYTMTMTIGANGQLTGSDSTGCIFNGTVGAPEAAHNMYAIEATVSACGSLDGSYRGMGALLDADAMTEWMTAMHPIEQGGHTHGGTMMGGSPMMGQNTVPSGQHNLFMFAMVNDQNAIMDALAR